MSSSRGFEIIPNETISVGESARSEDKNAASATEPRELLDQCGLARFVAHLRSPPPRLQQLCVFGLGFFEDGNVGVGVFPESQEILIRGTSLIAGGRILGRIEGVSASQPEAGQRAPLKVSYQAVVVNELSKFRRCCVAVVQH